ncbi:pyrroline-5-carboxylate reductase [Helicobacter sp. 23-1044]
MQKISIIGYGKMAKAIAVALNGRFALEIIGRNAKKMERFIRENALQNAEITPCAESNAIDIANRCVILAIKPYAFDSFRYRGKAHAIYSIMAGISIERLQKCAEAGIFVRVMPNVASLVGQGVSVIYAKSAKSCESSGESAESKSKNLKQIQSECESIFAPLGKCIFVDKESYINPSGAISGSGTAYLGLIAEAMIDAGVREGLSLEVSKELTRGLFSGFSALFMSAEAQTIRTDTTSPAGMSAEALAILENRGVRSAFMDAIHAANKKANSI